MKLPELRIGKLVAKVPIIQGGMAIRLSTSRLAAAVANEGGIGLIAASGMSNEELIGEIRNARRLTNNKGVIGINCMVAAREFISLVTTAAKEKIDLIVAGAGFSKDVFEIGRKYDVEIVPVVSSARVAKLAEKLGASAVIVEGTEAGGHLGTQRSVKEILPEVLEAVHIPVIAAGGCIDGNDVAEMIKLHANGVQMGSRFAASEESNGAPELKAFYLKQTQEDIVQIDSPVGYKGRAFLNPFSKASLEGEAPKPDSCQACLKHCKHNFCIIKALIRAQQGDVENGLVFTGANMWRIKEILPVKEIFRRIKLQVDAVM